VQSAAARRRFCYGAPVSSSPRHIVRRGCPVLVFLGRGLCGVQLRGDLTDFSPTNSDRYQFPGFAAVFLLALRNATRLVFGRFTSPPETACATCFDAATRTGHTPSTPSSVK
jgi:hypothetical protein